MCGLQVARDEEGNFQKYQFQFRQNEDGQLEAIPETVQLLPMEEEEEQVVDQPPVLDQLEQQPRGLRIFVQNDNSSEHILPDQCEQLNEGEMGGSEETEIMYPPDADGDDLVEAENMEEETEEIYEGQAVDVKPG